MLTLFLLCNTQHHKNKITVKHNTFTEQVGAAVTLWNCVWEVYILKLGWDSGYPERGFMWYYSFLPGKWQNSTSFRPSLHLQSIIHHSSCYLIQCNLDTDSLIKWTTKNFITNNSHCYDIIKLSSTCKNYLHYHVTADAHSEYHMYVSI
jgi:hypothetical protein